MSQFKVKFDAEHIGEIFSTRLTATLDYVATGKGYLELKVSEIEDEKTGHTYRYEELHDYDAESLHKAIEGARDWIDAAMKESMREAQADMQLDDMKLRELEEGD